MKPRNAPVSRNASSADGEVGPLAERLADVLEHLLEVRQLDHAEADQDRGGDRDQLDDLEPALLLVAAGDQPAGERAAAASQVHFMPRPRAGSRRLQARDARRGRR